MNLVLSVVHLALGATVACYGTQLHLTVAILVACLINMVIARNRQA